MNETGISKHDQVLAGMVISLEAATMQHLGKIKSPVTDQVERDLEQARGTIDILEMLKVKCRQDTPEEILQLLDSAVMDLQMNFLDEMKRENAADPETTEEPASSAEAEPAADPAESEPEK